MSKVNEKIVNLLGHSIVLILLIVIGAKVLLNTDTPNAFLYFYGITITSVLLVTFFFALFKYKDPYLEALKINIERENVPNPFISIMVAVFNEEEVISKCIDSLIAQDYENKEIIIINDCSTDNTLEILKTYESKGVRVLNLPKNVGKKRALAEGMRIAKGSIFAFSDSDSMIEKRGMSKAAEIFKAFPDVGAVSGHSRAWNAKTNLLTRIQDSWYEGQYGVRKAFESHYGAVTCVSGPFAVFRREAIFNYIPAWEKDTFLGQEFKFATDRTLTGFLLGSNSVGKRIKKKYQYSDFITKVNYPEKEWGIVYTKSARSLTVVPDSFGKMIKQQVRWKKSFIRNTFFTGSFYWKKPFLPALFYYLHILFVVVGPLIAFRHLVYLPYHGFASSAFLYLGGILLIGFMFGLAYKYDNREDNGWIYRPLMSIISTLFLSWILFYSALTIRKMVWHRG